MKSTKRIVAAVLALVLVAGSAAALPADKGFFGSAITAEAVLNLGATVTGAHYYDDNISLKDLSVSFTYPDDTATNAQLIVLDTDIRQGGDLKTEYGKANSASVVLEQINAARTLHGETSIAVVAQSSDSAVTGEAQTITLNLDSGAISNNTATAKKYYVYLLSSDEAGAWIDSLVGVVEAKADGELYYGNGADSGDVTAATKVAKNLADRTVTVTAPNATYTGSAYNGLSYSIDPASTDTPAVVYQGTGDTTYAASTTAPTNPGSYAVTVTYAATSTHKAASGTAYFEITKATVAVTAQGYTGTYDGASHEGATVTVTDPPTGATVVFYNEESGNYEYASSPKFKNAGNYTVKFKVTAPGYADYLGEANVVINKADVTVTADNLTKVYGEDDPQLTYKTSGLVEGETLEGSVTRESGNNAGTYAITQGTLAGGDNYNVNFVPGSLEITKRDVTIIADDKASQYGTELKELTYTGGDTVLEGDDLGINLTTEATIESDVGEYEIVVNWDTENPNYNVNAVNGKYTLTRGEMDVEASGYNGTYDGEAHGINVTISENTDAVIYYATEELTPENYETVGSTDPIEYTDAGEYIVYYYVASRNYEDDKVTGSQTIIISKAQAAATTAPAAVEGLKKTGKEQALVTAGETTDGKMVYALGRGKDEAPDEDAYSEDIPTGVEGGTYYVWYKIIGDENHTDSAAACIEVTIVDDEKKDDDTPEIIDPTDPENPETPSAPGGQGSNPGTGVAAGLGMLTLAAGAAIASKKKRK